MIYAAAAIALVIALLLGAVKVVGWQADTYRAERDTAVAANAQLAQSIDGVKIKCKAAQDALDREAKAAERRRKAALAEKAQADKLAADQREIIDRLARDANAIADGEANCAEAQAILDRLAKDRR